MRAGARLKLTGARTGATRAGAGRKPPRAASAGVAEKRRALPTARTARAWREVEVFMGSSCGEGFDLVEGSVPPCPHSTRGLTRFFPGATAATQSEKPR